VELGNHNDMLQPAGVDFSVGFRFRTFSKGKTFLSFDELLSGTYATILIT